MVRSTIKAAVYLLGLGLLTASARAENIIPPPATLDVEALAASVTIHRDAWGVPHIDGPTDLSVVFGFGYAQAEDYFVQVEDSYILSLGRYAEVHGSTGLNSDLLNRAFEIVPSARADFARLSPEARQLCEAFTSGLNYYLATHPEVQPKLIERFEPWYVLAYARHLTLELCFRYTRLNNNYLPRSNSRIEAAIGSNAWAISGKRTKSGRPMLMINPHQPWFGFGQMYEGHLRSGEGLNFTGATFFGNPLPSLGHNEHLGWALTTNEPDIADVWLETFDDPAQPLNYRYDGAYRTATEWTETIGVRRANDVQQRRYRFRKTHHGPIVGRAGDGKFLSARVASLYHTQVMQQSLPMLKARNFTEFRSAMAATQFPYMNILYADRDDNIFYLYNGQVPRRDPQFDWSKPVAGDDPRTEWQGMHSMSELPQTLNPLSGFLQNCNSSPFTVTDDGNPQCDDFPSYMVEDHADDKRRAKRSRELLGAMYDMDLDHFERAAFDTGVYWARHELPKYKQSWLALEATDPKLYARVEPYLTHLLDWDGRIRVDCTRSTLCQAWYERLHGMSYPGEKLLPAYADRPDAQLTALVETALHFEATYGDWHVAWGDVHRMQRPPNVTDLLELRFDDGAPSLPSLGAHGPMGVIFTQYNTPVVNLPFIPTARKRYGLIGTTYLAVFEFGDRIEGRSVLNFGQSGDPASPHYFDQAELLSKQQLKPSLFYWDEVLAGAKKSYHPGEQR